MTGRELDTLCEEWLDKCFPSYRRFYDPYYWLLDDHYPLIFRRVMRRFELDWRDKIGVVEVRLIDIDDARLALGLTKTAIPGCFSGAFAEGELIP